MYQRNTKEINRVIMAKLTSKIKENPKLHAKKLSDGRESLYLEYYLGRQEWIDEETEQLMKTRYDQQNPNVRRAFIFCLYTGVRFCDVKDLMYSDIDYSTKKIKFNQRKTQGHSSKSWVDIPLNEGLLPLLGEQPIDEEGNLTDGRIFNLPSQSMCLRSLKHWVKLAGINKHISWHCARHSFAVNILNNGANIKTVASLLGHSGLRHTEKYTRAVDSLKDDAVNSLPKVEL